MAETKYDKYFITELTPKVEAPWAPEFKPEEILRSSARTWKTLVILVENANSGLMVKST